MKRITDALRRRRATSLTAEQAPHKRPVPERREEPVTPETESVLRALHQQWGSDGGLDAQTMAATWRVTPYEDAYLVNSTQALRGSPLYLVRGTDVVSVRLTVTTIGDAYASLLTRTAPAGPDQ